MPSWLLYSVLGDRAQTWKLRNGSNGKAGQSRVRQQIENCTLLQLRHNQPPTTRILTACTKAQTQTRHQSLTLKTHQLLSASTLRPRSPSTPPRPNIGNHLLHTPQTLHIRQLRLTRRKLRMQHCNLRISGFGNGVDEERAEL